MLALNKAVKANIKKSVGLSASKLSSMTFGEIQEYLEKKKNKKFPNVNYNGPRLLGRGSVYLHLNRLIDSKKIDKKLSRI